MATDAGRYNVYVHFMDPDARQISPMSRVLEVAAQQAVIEHLLALACLVTRDYCILPPNFVIDDSVSAAAFNGAEALRAAGLIRLPMRESFDEYLAKKEYQYRPLAHEHPGYSSAEAGRVLAENADLIIDRPGQIGESLVRLWRAGPDSDGYFRTRLGDAPTFVQDAYSRLPARAVDRNLPITWSAFRTLSPDLVARWGVARDVMQHYYFGTYLAQMDAALITRTPYIGAREYGIRPPSIAYDYEVLRYVLGSIGLERAFTAQSGETIVMVRSRAEYFQFLDALADACAQAQTFFRLRRATALAGGWSAESEPEPDRDIGSNQLTLPGVHAETWLAALHSGTTVLRKATEIMGNEQASPAKPPGLARAREALARAGESVAAARAKEAERVKAFVSYSHEGEDVGGPWMNTVLDFARQLIELGIDAELDQFDEAWMGRDWSIWGPAQVQAADVILCIASPDYARKWNESVGSGAADEARTIRVAQAQGKPINFVVLPGRDAKTGIPWSMLAFQRYSVSSLDAGGLAELIRGLTAQPSRPKPPLGSVPVLPPDA